MGLRLSDPHVACELRVDLLKIIKRHDDRELIEQDLSVCWECDIV